MSTPARAPQRPPSRRPAAAPPARRAPRPRPDLRVVPASPASLSRRLTNPSVATVLAMVAVFGLLFALAAFHTVLMQGQVRLDDIGSRVATEQARYEQLRLRVAEQESPGRIVAEATQRLGMVPADDTTYLTPSGAVEAEIATAAAADGAPSPAGAEPDDVATGPQDWTEVKPYLGDTP
ncbi:MAG: hypothetical protein ACRD0U_08655 [Acidimicrobiales bacterium]